MKKKKRNKKYNYYNYETYTIKDFENHYYREIQTPIMKIRYDKMRDMIYVYD